MSNTTKLPQPIYELMQTLLDVRSQMEDVLLESGSYVGRYGGDARIVRNAAQSMLETIDTALDLIKYNEA